MTSPIRGWEDAAFRAQNCGVDENRVQYHPVVMIKNVLNALRSARIVRNVLLCFPGSYQ